MKKFLLLNVFLFSFCLIPKETSAQFGNPVLVTNSNDSGPGSLRQAILDFNNSSAGQIVFQLPNFNMYLVLQSPLPVLKWSNGMISAGTSAYITIVAGSSAVAESDGLASFEGGKGGNMIRTITSFGPSSKITYQYFRPKAFVVTTTENDVNGSFENALLKAEFRKVTPYDSIVFNVPGTAPHVFTPASYYYEINSPVIIDGSTQPANGYTGSAPKIEFEGTRSISCFYFNGGNSYSSGPDQPTYSSGSQVHGMYIHGFGTAISYYNGYDFVFGKPGKGNVISDNGYGIVAATYGATNVTIQNNIIGLDPTGTTAMPNSYGIKLLGDRVFVLNNTISGNTNEAIGINSYMGSSDYCQNLTIKGNKIGTSADGTIAIPNKHGIYLRNSNHLTIGGPGSERNIISGNNESGISLWSGSYNNSLFGVSIVNNYIGTDITGTLDLGNGTYGISTSYTDTITAAVGGENLGNIIAYNKIGVTGNKGVKLLNNSFFANDIGIERGFLPAPVITNRSSTVVEGTAVAGSKVQLFEDDGFNTSPQGKIFIAEVNADASGNWSYTGAIDKPCQVTAICIQPEFYRSSGFSFGSKPDLVPDTLIFCNGEQAVVKAENGFADYTWNTSFAGQTLSTTTPGKYWVSVDNGCSYADTVQVLFMERPTVALGNDTSYCNSQTYVLRAPQIPKATYAWTLNGANQSNTTANYTIYQSGTYIVHAIVGKCVARDTIQIKVNAIPNILTKATVNKCAGEAYTITKPAGHLYQWSDGSTSNTFTTTAPGVYTVLASSAEGNCASSLSRDTITINDVILDLNLGNDTSICGTTPLVKNLSDIGATAYYWSKKSVSGYYQNVSTSSAYSITQSGSYALMVTKGNCIRRDTMQVTFNLIPKVVLGNDTIVCAAITLASRQNFAGAQYTWSDGSSNTTLPVTVSGTYRLEIKYDENCLSKDTIVVDVVNCNAFEGIVYADKNNTTTYESSDSLLKGELVQARKADGQTYYTITDANGKYHFDLPAGIYTVKTGIASAYITKPSLTYYTINAGQAPAQSSYDFAIDLPAKELSISMTSPFSVRLGTVFETRITIRNAGRDSQRGLVTMHNDPFFAYYQSPVSVISLTNQQLVFDAGDLRPGQEKTFSVFWTLPINETLLNKTFLLSANIEADAIAENNHALNSVLCRYPFDPNHKYVAVQYDPSTEQARDSKRLQYIVEFQNTGNDTAYQVVIVDTLSKKLNPLTFQAGPSSAPYTWTMDAGGVVTFTFANIHLPDSNVNQMGSRGFVSFTIDHLLPGPGDSLYNEAAIFFDMAAPVITDKVYYKIPQVQNIQALSLNALSSVKYGHPYVMIDAEASSGLPVSYAYDGPVQLRGDTLFILGVGTVRVEAFQAGNHEFLSAVPQFRSFEISKGDQEIYFEEIADKQQTDAPFTLQAFGGNSGNPVLFEILSGPAVVEGNTVTLTGTGEVEIAATQAGNNLYEDAIPVTQVFRVTVVTSVEDGHMHTVQAGPNPFSDYIIIHSDRAEKERYEIFDLQGQLVDAGIYYTGKQVALEHLMKGCYVLKVYREEQMILVQKLLKQ